MPAEPNPVAQIITTRALQAAIGDAAFLMTAYALLPPTVFWRGIVPANAVLATGGMCAYFTAVFVPGVLPQPVPLFGVPPRFHRLPADAKNSVALTFDDGPHPDTTPSLLDILATHQSKATFFLVGERAARYPQLVARIACEGHTIGVHGLRHRTMVLQSPTEAVKDVQVAQTIIENAIGAPLPSRLLRPPYGFKTWVLCRAMARAGWTIVDWSLDVRDYADDATPKAIAARFEQQIRRASENSKGGGEIVLLHEQVPASGGTPRPQTTLAALPEILQTCKKNNLQCVALNPSRRPGAN